MMPALFMVATDVLRLLHVPPDIALLAVAVPPSQKLGAPPIGPRAVLPKLVTGTVLVAGKQPLL